MTHKILTSLRSRAWSLAFWAYSFLLTGVLLYPLDFNFEIREPPGRLPGGGIQFTEPGLVRSRKAPESLFRRLTAGSGLTVETWLSTASFDQGFGQGGPAWIASYSLNSSLHNFTLGQDGTALVFWLRTGETNQDRANPELWEPNFFRLNSIQHVALTYDFSRQRAFLDGKRLYEAETPAGRFLNWDSRFQLVLGNEANGTRPWRGTLLLLAIYSRPLSNREIENNYRAGIRKTDTTWADTTRVAEGLTALYLFDEFDGSVIADESGSLPAADLEIVSGDKVWQKPFLAFSSAYFDPRRATFRDCAINFLLFVPFGFLAYRRFAHPALRIRSFLHAIVLGLALSAAAEIFQYYSFTRQSSLNDIFSNVFGSAMGAALAEMCRRVQRRLSYAGALVPNVLR